MFGCDDTDELAPTFSPTVFVSVDAIPAMGSPTASLLGKPVSVFGLSLMTMTLVVHLG